MTSKEKRFYIHSIGTTHRKIINPEIKLRMTQLAKEENSDDKEEDDKEEDDKEEDDKEDEEDSDEK